MAESVREWQPIDTAPKDGRAVWVSDPDCGPFLMAWNPRGTNDVFAPGEVGIWEALDGSFTWRAGEFGPSLWCEP